MRYISTEKSTKDVAESDKNVAQSKKKNDGIWKLLLKVIEM